MILFSRSLCIYWKDYHLLEGLRDPVNMDCTKLVHFVESALTCIQASYSSLLEFQSKQIQGLCACQIQESLNVCLHLSMVMSVWLEHSTGAFDHY